MVSSRFQFLLYSTTVWFLNIYPTKGIQRGYAVLAVYETMKSGTTTRTATLSASVRLFYSSSWRRYFLVLRRIHNKILHIDIATVKLYLYLYKIADTNEN